MFIPRLLRLPQNKNFFLFGPRQTGKSTLIKSLFLHEKSIYYDLLSTDIYRRFAANPETLRAEVRAALSIKKPTHIIIDEVQKVPQLLDEVHLLIESGLPLYYILSGSSSRKLKRSHANMLAGRAWTFRLFPLTFLEIEYLFNLNKVLRFGTLPNVHLTRDDNERSEILRSYVDVYIKEEIELEANIRNLGGFLRFLPIVAAQNGEITNYFNIAREAGVSYHTVREYYKILEDTLLGFFHLPYGRSIRKKLVKHPKFYFFDTGVVSALTKKLRVPYQENTYEFGRAFEHFFICELMRLNEYKRLDLGFSFYRTERGSEVDCIVETPKGKTIAVEIKSTMNPASTHCSGLYSFKQKVPDAELILACRTSNSLKINKVMVLPWKEALKYIVESGS